ncbi:hypothetical protein [Streptomyces liliifuscus]|uniref:Uncharacterized protein n=1 Tax=Streptomyces liliifuscus TaxID=2797636 RepID=A0A7T7I6T6_9ACTN|nr:hypothetical protein [Streptomyces liliifuscus]QQM41992.1 hypothetical protein JEQ17_22795 [Streptomyces liliifuscus]
MADAELERQLHQLGQDARDVWQAGATQHDVLVHVVVSLGGWTRDDENHLELLDALARIRERLEATTPP